MTLVNFLRSKVLSSFSLSLLAGLALAACENSPERKVIETSVKTDTAPAAVMDDHKAQLTLYWLCRTTKRKRVMFTAVHNRH